MSADLDLVGVVCPACSSDRAEYMGRRGAFRWFRCAECGTEHGLQERETAHERLLRQSEAAGYQVANRGHDFTILVHFHRKHGDTYPLQWAVQAAEGEPVRVRKLLDYEGWRPVAEPTVPAMLAAIEAAEIEDTAAMWPELEQWHAIGLVIHEKAA